MFCGLDDEVAKAVLFLKFARVSDLVWLDAFSWLVLGFVTNEQQNFIDDFLISSTVLESYQEFCELFLCDCLVFRMFVHEIEDRFEFGIVLVTLDIGTKFFHQILGCSLFLSFRWTWFFHIVYIGHLMFKIVLN